MTARRLGALMLVAAAACAPTDPHDVPDPDTWVGTVTTEGIVTTVANEAGSIWGGQGTLVEEATIGVDAGADEYMFGRVADVWAWDDKLLVLDSQIPAVRVYDWNGAHLYDIGRAGQGPGEFTDPAGLAVTSSGDVVVVESNLQIDIFAPDGESKATWNDGSPVQIAMPDMVVLGHADELWIPALDMETRSLGRAKVGPDGSAGDIMLAPEPDLEPACLTFTRRGREAQYCNIPYAPFAYSTLAPDGSWIVGPNNQYAFEVRRPDGTILRIERYWDPVPVSDDERNDRTRQTTEMVRERFADDSSWTWNGPEIPDHKPAFMQLMPDRNGRIWALRERESRRSSDCPSGADECWVAEGYWLDGFDTDGRFLGTLTPAEPPATRPFIDDDTFVFAVIDDAGTLIVKRYRLVLPGAE